MYYLPSSPISRTNSMWNETWELQEILVEFPQAGTLVPEKSGSLGAFQKVAIISSPNFQANYPNDLHERKIIEVAKGNAINIHFTEVMLEIKLTLSSMLMAWCWGKLISLCLQVNWSSSRKGSLSIVTSSFGRLCKSSIGQWHAISHAPNLNGLWPLEFREKASL